MKAKDPDISHAEVRNRFEYEQETGKLLYRVPPPNQSQKLIGTEAGYIRQTKYGKYRVIKFGKIAVYTHRLIWFYMTGEWPKGQIDHRDGDKLNNRFLNFRVATHSQNKSNGSLYKNSTTGLKGVTKQVSKSGLRWKAQITFQGSVIYLGLHESKDAAHQAYLDAVSELQGRFANPG